MGVMVKPYLSKLLTAEVEAVETNYNLGQETGAVRKTNSLIGRHLELEARQHGGHTAQIACPVNSKKGANE